MQKREDPRNFWDKLFRRKQKTVKSTDEYGRTLTTVYTFDRHGGIIGTAEYDLVAGNKLVIRKEKSYKRREDGSYDPWVSTYYDTMGQTIKVKQYSRDADGMLCGQQSKYTHIQGNELLTEQTYHTYDGGLWTVRRKEEYEYDPQGNLVHERYLRRPESGSDLVCTKDKTYAKNAEGFYDPKETTYFDEQGQITKKRLYHREMTEIYDKPLLFADTTTYSYTDGQQKVSDHYIRWTFNPSLNWGSMESLAEATERVRQEKAEKIRALEAQLAELKGEKKPTPTDTQRLAALRRGMDPH